MSNLERGGPMIRRVQLPSGQVAYLHLARFQVSWTFAGTDAEIDGADVLELAKITQGALIESANFESGGSHTAPASPWAPTAAEKIVRAAGVPPDLCKGGGPVGKNCRVCHVPHGPGHTYYRDCHPCEQCLVSFGRPQTDSVCRACGAGRGKRCSLDCPGREVHPPDLTKGGGTAAAIDPDMETKPPEHCKGKPAKLADRVPAWVCPCGALFQVRTPPTLTKGGGGDDPLCDCGRPRSVHPIMEGRRCLMYWLAPPDATKVGGSCTTCGGSRKVFTGETWAGCAACAQEVGADVRIRDYTEPLPPPRGGPIPGVPMFSAEHRAAVRAALCTVPDCPNAPAPGWLICADHGGGGGGGVTK